MNLSIPGFLKFPLALVVVIVGGVLLYLQAAISVLLLGWILGLIGSIF